MNYTNEKVAQNKFFTAYRLCDGITRISGMAMENCYLVEGRCRALLIDGLSGVGTLMPFIRELTELPVTVTITHGHLDHTGAAWECEQIYINPLDVPLMYLDQYSSPKSRLDFVELVLKLGVPARTKPTLADTIPVHPLKTYPVMDGDIFDLGGLEIEAIHVPGHTWGSTVFLDRTHRLVFAGDACNSNTLLNLTGSASVEEYLEGLKHLDTFAAEFDALCNGHDPMPVSKKVIADAMQLCRKILTREDASLVVEDLFGGKSLSALTTDRTGKLSGGSLSNIIYHEDTIFRGKRAKK